MLSKIEAFAVFPAVHAVVIKSHPSLITRELSTVIGFTRHYLLRSTRLSGRLNRCFLRLWQSEGNLLTFAQCQQC